MHNYNTPIYDAILSYTGIGPVPFHMPGHKLGRGIPEAFLRNVAALDITELPGTDNLHKPTGPIREAQRLAAAAFGADRTWFLVNGSTVGIHTAISTMCSSGLKKIIVSRNCHKAVLGGMLLAGAEPVFVMPRFNHRFGIMGCVDPAEVEKALAANPDTAGVFLTRPDYYGVCCDLRGIADMVHSHGKILAVDEAHGAHLRFNGGLPVCAMDAGADLCVQSAHKTLPAFTQGAYLHARDQRIDVEHLEFMLDILQTTSPSYILMAFLDIARSIMQQEGEQLLGNVLREIRQWKSRLAGVSGLKFLEPADIDGGLLDETRITANFEECGITGFDVQHLLRRDYGVEVEMSDFSNVVAIATVADDPAALNALFHALSGAAAACSGRSGYGPGRIPGREFSLPPAVLGLTEVFKAGGETVSLEYAEGRICKSIVAPYPPGIPLIYPGERITGEAVEYLRETLRCGGSVTGLSANLQIQVCKSQK